MLTSRNGAKGKSGVSKAPERKAGLDPNGKIPAMLAAGLGLQLAGLLLPGIVLMPTIVFLSASQSEGVLLWGVFASVVACGAVTMLQALRAGRLGAGYFLTIGTAGVAITVSIAALRQGGPALLAGLVCALALFQFAFAARLSLFRRVLTPLVTGTIIILTPVTIMPVIFEQLANVPEGSPPLAAPLSAFTALAVIAGIVLRAKQVIRLWAPVIGVVAGSMVASVFGLYDFDRIAAASWVGIPRPELPIPDLGIGFSFWALLPSFVFIALVCTIQTIGNAVAVQRASWDRPRAIDFRAVQGAVTADGAGNLLSGLAGTMPLGFRPQGAAMIAITGLSSRWIGVALGAALILLSLLPKALAVFLAIPGPVVAAFITVMMATIFIAGIKVIAQDGLDYRKGLIAGLSFWIGIGFEFGLIFPEHAADFAGGLLQNGMTAGGLAAILMTAFMELTKPRRRRIELKFDFAALHEIREFLRKFAARSGWGEGMVERLDAVSEETMLTLLREDEAGEEPGPRRLLLIARSEDGGAVLEFVAAKGEENLQDRIALLGEVGGADEIEREVSLRLLRHLASSVRHQQYHDTDIVTVRVEPPV